MLAKIPGAPPDLCPLLVVANWTTLSPSELLDLIADGYARGERIKGSWHICVSDLERPETAARIAEMRAPAPSPTV